MPLRALEVLNPDVRRVERVEEARRVPRGEDARPGGAPVLVDHDPAIDLQPRPRRQVRARDRANRHQGGWSARGSLEAQLDAVLLVHAREERAEILPEHTNHGLDERLVDRYLASLVPGDRGHLAA